MNMELNHTVFVMQSGVDPKDIYIAQTSDNPADIVHRYNSSDNPKSLPKPLGQMLPLTLRLDLAGVDNVFTDQSSAIEYRKKLSEEFEKQPYRYNLKSKRSFFFGRKKSTKDKQTGKYSLALDPSLVRINDRVSSRDGKAEVFSYGRKKSSEWNDDTASKLEAHIAEKIRQRRNDK